MQNVLGEPTGAFTVSYAKKFSVDYYGDYTCY